MSSTNKDCPFPALWTPDKPTELTAEYERWGASYDKDVNGINYIAPKKVAESLAAYFPKDRRNIKILDVGAGTGLVGVELQKLGFRSIDGLDPSQRMLDVARATRAYTYLFCKYFTAEPTQGLVKDSYDVIISAGSLLLGHLPTDCFIEAVRLVRPGGIICMIARTGGKGNFNEMGYRDQFKAVNKQLQREKKLDQIKWEKVQYYRSTEGVIMVYRVL